MSLHVSVRQLHGRKFLVNQSLVYNTINLHWSSSSCWVKVDTKSWLYKGYISSKTSTKHILEDSSLINTGLIG